MGQMPNPLQMMIQAGNPQNLAKMLKDDKEVMNSEMGKNFVGMLEKGDMSGVAGLGKNVSQTMGFTPDNLKQRIPENIRKMIGL